MNMGQQVQPQHNTPHPDPSLFIFSCTQGLTWASPPELLPPTPCSRAGSQHRPQPSLHPLPPCLGKGGTGPPTKGHKSRGGGPAIPPLPQGTTGKENCVFPKLSYSFLLGLMHTQSSHSSRGFSVSLPAPTPAVAPSSHGQCHPVYQGPEIKQLHSGCCTAHLPLHTRQCCAGIVRALHGAKHLASAPRPAAGTAHRGCRHCPACSSLDACPWRSRVEDPSASWSF